MGMGQVYLTNKAKRGILAASAFLLACLASPTLAVCAETPSGQISGVSDSRGKPAYYPFTDDEFSTREQEVAIAGGRFRTHDEIPISDGSDYYCITDWECAFQYTYLDWDSAYNQVVSVYDHSVVEMDGRVETVLGGLIEPYSFHTLVAGQGGRPTSRFIPNPKVGLDRWYDVLPEPYQAYKGQGKTIRVEKYLRAVDAEGTETLLPTGSYRFTDENISRPMQYTVQKGDCLYRLAGEWYGNPLLWNQLYERNRNAILNPDMIYTGQTIHKPFMPMNLVGRYPYQVQH